jgi:hypothetical protein
MQLSISCEYLKLDGLLFFKWFTINQFPVYSKCFSGQQILDPERCLNKFLNIWRGRRRPQGQDEAGRGAQGRLPADCIIFSLTLLMTWQTAKKTTSPLDFFLFLEDAYILRLRVSIIFFIQFSRFLLLVLDLVSH